MRLSDELLSQAVMVVESCRPTLTINLAGARQHWLEGMLRHEIGERPLTHTGTNHRSICVGLDLIPGLRYLLIQKHNSFHYY